MKVTVSVIKADIGSYVGHCKVHPRLIEKANQSLEAAKKQGKLIDFFITNCGDDLELLMTHTKGEDNKEIHQLAWNTFLGCAKLAREMKLYGAGQDLLKDSFSGNLKGMGPGTAEMEIEERPSEPVVIFMADKTEPGAWNMPLFKMFADPFSTAGLVIDPSLHQGFEFEIHDVIKNRMIKFRLPEEMYDMLALIGQPGRFVVKRVFRRKDGEIASVSSSDRLNLIAGKYVGKDDPVLIVRAQSGFPAVGEVVEPFAFPHIVAGWMRGSHHGPFMPVGQKSAQPTRFDGPPRVIALGFQLNSGKFGLPLDLFEDVSFDRARKTANKVADYLRRHGPFEAHRLSAEEMEYTTLPDVMKKLENRWKAI